MNPENRLTLNGTAVGYGLLAGFLVGYLIKENVFMLHVHTPELVACMFFVWMTFLGSKSLLRSFQPTAGMILSLLSKISDKVVMGYVVSFIGGFEIGLANSELFDYFFRR